jgi:DNA-binding MarR family transcriptional regulator
MKLWFEVLARARLNRSRTPVFLVIDEFQFVADLPIIDTILSEARKYGLHLVIAHQHTKQVPDVLLQSIMSNCAVKVAFLVGGGDIKKLATMDASFADSLAKALTGLTIGKAVVKLTARSGEQQPPPVVVQLDYIPHEAKRPSIYIQAFDPGEPSIQDLRGLLNPVLKYIEPIKPLEFFVLYTLYREKRLAITDLATRIGVSRGDVEDAVNSLAGWGFVEVYREGNRRIAKYVKGLFRGLKKATPSEEGYRLAKKVLLYYVKRSYVVVPARQDPALSSRPDLVAIPVDKSTWRPIYNKAMAIEVESCNEVETHPEQVARNWVKESTRDFAEVHTWTWQHCFDKLRQVYEKVGVDKVKVKIFSAKPVPEKPMEVREIVKQAQPTPPIRKIPVKSPVLKALEEPGEEGGGPIVEHVEPLQATGMHASQRAVEGGESGVSTSQPPAPPSGDTVAQSLAPGMLSPLERVFTASDGRRYMAVFPGVRELNLFDKVCREGYSIISVNLKDGVVECRPRGYTVRFTVRASSLGVLE